MTVFTHDWTVTPRAEWPALFDAHQITADKPWRFLEIGCFEGQTTLWLLDTVLAHPGSSVTVVDTFAGEFDHIREPDYPARFSRNIADHVSKVVVRKGRSGDVLPTLRGTFDFVYVDGSHLEDDVWADATLSWPLLRRGGIMVFDDYVRPEVSAAVRRFVGDHADAHIHAETSQCSVVKR